MKLNLKLPGRLQNREGHLRGTLISTLNVLDEILLRKRKATYLLHFVEERLDKSERKEFSIFLKLLIQELQREGSRGKTRLGEANSPGSIELLRVINSFGERGISERATALRQLPEAGSIPSRAGIVLKVIEECNHVD